MSSTRVYVGNLAWATKTPGLEARFSTVGKVVVAKVVEGQQGRSQGWGYVQFEKAAEAAEAVKQLNGSELDGRPIEVRLFSTKPLEANTESEVARRVYVGNLAWKTSWQDLKDFFKQIGSVKYADVIRSRDDQRSRGFGIVEFETHEEAVSAIRELNGAIMAGREIIVRPDKRDRELAPAAPVSA